MASVPGSMFGRIVGMTRGEGLRAQLLRGGIGSIAVKIASTGLVFAVAVVLARVLGPEGYGIYAYAFALVSVLAIPAQFGLPNLVIRETAKAEANGEWGLMRGLWRWATGVTGAISLALALVAGGLAWVFADRFGEMQLATFAWGLLLVPLMALGAVYGGALRGLRKVVTGQLPQFVLRHGFLVAFVLGAAFLWSGAELTPAGAMALHAVAAAAAFAIGAWMLARSRPGEMRAASAPRTVYRPLAWMAAALPLALVAGMMMINQHTDILMLGLFRSAEDVGVYRVVVQSGMLVVFGLQAADMVVAPQFARLHSLNDTASLQRVATISARVALAIALPVALAFIFFGDAVLGWVFGPAFAVGHTALAIIVIGQFVNASFGSAGYLLNMTGHERDTARGVAIAAGCNIGLNLILIPPLGMNGAAMATALTFVIWNALLWRDAKRRLQVDSNAFSAIR